MMGAKARLFTPLYARSLDELVPADHFYRHVDRVLDLSFVPDTGAGLLRCRYGAAKCRSAGLLQAATGHVL